LVLVNAPVVSLADARRADRDEAVSALLGVLRDHASPTSLMAILMGEAASNELHLPGGSFGEAHVVAGTGSAPAADLWRRGESGIPGRESIALVDGFDDALMDELSGRVALGSVGPLTLERAQREAYPSDVMPVRGWWSLELDGREVQLSFRLESGHDGYPEIYRIHYTRQAGWVASQAEASGPE
jgi:hypothetical protein